MELRSRSSATQSIQSRAAAAASKSGTKPETDTNTSEADRRGAQLAEKGPTHAYASLRSVQQHSYHLSRSPITLASSRPPPHTLWRAPSHLILPSPTPHPSRRSQTLQPAPSSPSPASHILFNVASRPLIWAAIGFHSSQQQPPPPPAASVQNVRRCPPDCLAKVRQLRPPSSHHPHQRVPFCFCLHRKPSPCSAAAEEGDPCTRQLPRRHHAAQAQRSYSHRSALLVRHALRLALCQRYAIPLGHLEKPRSNPVLRVRLSAASTPLRYTIYIQLRFQSSQILWSQQQHTQLARRCRCKQCCQLVQRRSQHRCCRSVAQA